MLVRASNTTRLVLIEGRAQGCLRLTPPLGLLVALLESVGLSVGALAGRKVSKYHPLWPVPDPIQNRDVRRGGSNAK